MHMIALTGDRQVGKSRLSEYLVETQGFVRVHPFGGGKAACEAFFTHLGAAPLDAWNMVHGNLKDRPSSCLPVGPDGEHHSPRFFMEKFGAFMGVTLGADWTLGSELSRLRAAGTERVILESVAFEAEAFRDMGGIIIRIERDGASKIKGIETDAWVERIVPDHVFRNDQPDLESGKAAFSEFLRSHGLIGEPAPVEEPVPGF